MHRTPYRRRWAPAAALVSVALLVLGATGCGSGSDPAAITVGNKVIPQSEIDDQLQAITQNPQLKAQAVTKAGRLRPEVAAVWLTQVVDGAVAAAQVARDHLHIQASDRATAQQQANLLFGGQSVFAKFPKAFRTATLARFANVAAVVRAKGTAPTDAEVRSEYDTSIAKNCPSNRYISHILVATLDEAKTIKSELAAGADFAKLAMQKSTDTQSAQRGGDLSCLDGQQIDPTFLAAANALPLGTVSDPVQTQYGWHIIRARDVHDAAPFESLQDEIRKDLTNNGPAGQVAIAALIAHANVKIVPKYGRWVVSDGQGHVVARGESSTPTTTAPTPSSTP
jgi:parvulin-like peptidyl-prolyl isomerase